MPPMLTHIYPPIRQARDVPVVRIPGVLSIQRRAGFGTVVKAGWLRSGVVSETVGDEFDAVGGAEVERIWGAIRGVDEGALEVDCGGHGAMESGRHFFEGVFAFE